MSKTLVVGCQWKGYLLTNGPLGAENHYSTTKTSYWKCNGFGQITEIE
jgi:hypothetical protein